MSSRRDYKRSQTGQRRRQRARHHALLVLTLVLVGLFGGLLAYIKGDRTPPAPATAAVAPTAPAQPPAAPPPKTVVAPVAEPAPVKPKYDFYTELPKRQIDIRRETVNPKVAPPPSPARTQPATDQLRKPAAPRKNTTTTTPTVAAVHGAKPNSRPANSKPANSEPANAKPASATTPVRTAQPPRPLANSGSKIAVKTE